MNLAYVVGAQADAEVTLVLLLAHDVGKLLLEELLYLVEHHVGLLLGFGEDENLGVLLCHERRGREDGDGPRLPPSTRRANRDEGMDVGLRPVVPLHDFDLELLEHVFGVEVLSARGGEHAMELDLALRSKGPVLVESREVLVHVLHPPMSCLDAPHRSASHVLLPPRPHP